MFRIISVLVILAIVEYSHGFVHGYWGSHYSHGGHSSHGGHGGRGRNCHHHEETIDEKITSIGNQLSFELFCRNNATITPTILYGDEAYIIKYSLPDADDCVTVKIENGLIVTNVEGQGDFKGFKDVRVLPEMLNVSAGHWSIINNDLRILLPYKVPLGQEFIAECPSQAGIVNVPQGEVVGLQ